MGIVSLSGFGGGSGLSKELLWENASPRSSFAAQTISIDLSSYDQVAINFNFDVTFSWISGLYVFNKNSEKGVRVSEIYDQYGMSRKITNITDAGVYFGGGVQTIFNGGSYQNNDGQMIPYQIYGIKGVSA